MWFPLSPTAETFPKNTDEEKSSMKQKKGSQQIKILNLLEELAYTDTGWSTFFTLSMRVIIAMIL